MASTKKRKIEALKRRLAHLEVRFSKNPSLTYDGQEISALKYALDCIDKAENDFVRGYACAAAVIAKTEGADQGKDLLGEGGFGLSDLVEANCEQCDIDAIYPPDEDDSDDGGYF